MSDVTDIDPSLRALDALADDFAEPGDETPGCASMWPLLAVPSDALSPLDRDARDAHLARCARCRVAMTDAWLDAGADLAPVRAVLPAATALPTLPDRRRRGVKILAGLSVAAAAAASLFAIVFPMMHGAGDHTVAPIIGPPAARPLDLIFVVEDGARTPDTLAAVNTALGRMRDHVASDTRVTIAAAHDHDLDVLARDRSPADALEVAPLDRDAVAPAYNEVLGDADALFRDPSRRRAIVIIGDACGDFGGEQSVDSVRGNGVAVVAAELRPAACNTIVHGAFVARNSFQIVGTIGDAIEAALREAGSAPDAEHRPPLDLLVLIEGSSMFLGNSSVYETVRATLDEVDPHVPEHSLIRVAVADGDAVTQLGHGDYPYIPLAREILGPATSYRGKDIPRWSIALERARHLLDARHERQRALLVIRDGDDAAPAEQTARRRQLDALRADGVKVAFVTYGREVGDAGDVRWTTQRTALTGLVFDAVEDLSRPDPTSPPADLLHFVHDTLSAP